MRLYIYMQIESIYKIFEKHPHIQTDSRKVKPGDIFFALKGPNFNGNVFALQALKNGAACVLADENVVGLHEQIIYVGNALQTLQELASYHRSQLKDIPVIAITGSNGKTTTKELLNALLNTTYKTYTTEGNLNNHIGIPLTLLRIRADADIAVIEMGANHQGEIEGYCKYARPTHGLITNCGKAHLEGFGGLEGVRKGKGELFNYLKLTGGTAFVNADDPILFDMTRGISSVVTYGVAEGMIRGCTVDKGPLLSIKLEGDPDIIFTNLIGEYNFYNILAACAIAKTFSVPNEKIKSAIQSYSPSNNRSQLIKTKGNTVILDAYNANPTSMRAAIENLAELPGTKKVLLLGGMMELGAGSEEEHLAIISLIDKYKWEMVALVGNTYPKAPSAYLRFENVSLLSQWIRGQGFLDSTILVKGSRSMQMELVLDSIL